MENNNQTLADAFTEQYKDVDPVGDREEAMTGESTQFEMEEETQETTEQPVAESTEEVEATDEEGQENEENVEEGGETPEATDSSLNSEESSNTEETKPTEESTFDFDAEFAKRTDGKFNSIDEMMETLNAPKEEPKLEYGNELIAKLDELAKQGVNVDLDFVMGQMVDYSSYDVENSSQALDLVKQQLKLDEPDITDRELQFEISEKYKLDEDVYDEDDIERSKMRLMRDAKKARKALEKSQKDIALPKGGVDPEKQRQAEEAQRQANEKLVSTLKDGLNKYDKESMKIGEESFDYQLTPETKKSLESTILNTDKYFTQYIEKDGSIAVDRLNSDMMWANPTTREAMLSSFLQQATAKGSKDVVTDIKNTSISGKSPKASGSDNSQAAQIARHFEQKRK